MSKFKVGQKIRLAPGQTHINYVPEKLYTVRHCQPIYDHMPLVTVEEHNTKAFAERFELVTEQKMNKFKPGDKVRCKVDYCGQFTKDKIYTIREFCENWCSVVKDDLGKENGFSDCHFELVRDSLDELIKTANAGLEALETLRQNYADKIELSYRSGQIKPVNINDGNLQSVQLKQKSLTPFTTSNGWEVKLEGDNLHIGCKKFNAYRIKEVLRSLNDNGERYEVEKNSFRAAKSGIKFESHVLPWTDAEKILTELKKLEQK